MFGLYSGSFSSWEDVCEQFQAQIPEPDQVVYAVYDCPSYEGYADVIYRVGDRYFWACGSHCSCYGLEDQWQPEEYSLAELVEVLQRGDHFWYAEDPSSLRDELVRGLLSQSQSVPGHA